MKSQERVWLFYLVTPKKVKNASDLEKLAEKYPGLNPSMHLISDIDDSIIKDSEVILHPANTNVSLILYAVATTKKIAKRFKRERNMKRFHCIRMEFSDDFEANEWLDIYAEYVISDTPLKLLTRNSANKKSLSYVEPLTSLTEYEQECITSFCNFSPEYISTIFSFLYGRDLYDSISLIDAPGFIDNHDDSVSILYDTIKPKYKKALDNLDFQSVFEAIKMSAETGVDVSGNMNIIIDQLMVALYLFKNTFNEVMVGEKI